MLVRRLSSLALTLLLPFAAACGSAESPSEGELATTSAAISGGYTSDADTAVVGIVSFSGGMGVCSGSLIMPNLVLTARHCVAPVLNEVGGGVDCDVTKFGTTYQPNRLYVTTRTELPYSGAGYYSAAEIMVPTDSDFCGNDMALIVLEEAIPSFEATPLTPRVDTAIIVEYPFTTPGEEYSAVGYGITADDKEDSGLRRRRDNLNATCVEKQCPTYFGMTPTEWLGDTGICSGDSGGPALDLQNRVIGVVSRGGPNCSTPIYGSVHAWGDWIMTGAQHAAQVAGAQAPNWALGWPTDPAYYAPIGMACEYNSQCDSGLCADGRCTRPCTELAVCPDAYSCTGGRCAPQPVGDVCAADGDCVSGLCRDGVCSRSCSAEAVCPDGWACDGSCRLLPVGQACTAAAECETGNCLDGRCTRACGAESPCPAAFTCDEGAQVCVILGVGDACGVDGDCRSGMCQDGYCTRACGNQAECPTGYACDAGAGRCLLIPVGGACTGEVECGAGTCAAEGYCTRGCDDLAPCADGYLCDQGQCALIDVGASCTDGSTCEGGLCQGGICTRACSEQAPCPDGFRCGADGTCAKIDEGGCAAGGGTGLSATLALALGALLALARRRRA